MAKIKVLPQTLINQIAAGEVVERPSSVVKELTENALDAGATAIEITLRKAGRELIAICDNGCGMSPEDAHTALEAHATSKIASFEDLQNVTTMGFRGEALPSIASVSHFRLTTRESDADEGTEIKLEGGKIVEEGPVAAAVGTTIAVEHLFYNVPARRKFLKSDSTELSRCVEISRVLALAHRGVAFRLKDGNRVIFDIPAHESLRERVLALFPRLHSEQLLDVGAYEERVAFTGIISTPLHMQPSRDSLQFFVNDRPVEGKTFAMVLKDAYGDIMGLGRYPAAFLFLTIPPTDVDANVHPAKREVRLRDERSCQAFMTQALVAVLAGRAGTRPTATLDVTLPPIMTAGINGLPRFSAPTFTPTPPPFATPSNFLKDLGSPAAPTANFSAGSLGQSQTRLGLAESADGFPWRFLGFASADFALFSTPDGVAIFSISAAQARVAADKVAAALADGSARAQGLLVGALLSLDPRMEEALKENLEEFTRQGFIVAPFGQGTYRLEAIPDYLTASHAAGNPEALLLAILGALAEGESPASVFSADEMGARVAKKYLSGLRYPEEALNLAKALLQSKSPLKSPTGAPTFWEISFAELGKKFGKNG